MYDVQSQITNYVLGKGHECSLLFDHKCPSAGVRLKTPQEVLSSHVVDYTHLRVFGSISYAHVNDGKLKPRAKKCLLLRYPLGVKGYKLWSIDDKKAIIS